MSDLTLSYGRNAQLPDGVTAVWGARLIWPNDLLHDRQDLKATDDEAKRALIAWLNGPGNGNGALHHALGTLAEMAVHSWRSDSTNEATIYEDAIGRIVGSPQGSHGYVYVAAYLHPRGI